MEKVKTIQPLSDDKAHNLELCLVLWQSALSTKTHKSTPQSDIYLKSSAIAVD